MHALSDLIPGHGGEEVLDPVAVLLLGAFDGEVLRDDDPALAAFLSGRLSGSALRAHHGLRLSRRRLRGRGERRDRSALDGAFGCDLGEGAGLDQLATIALGGAATQLPGDGIGFAAEEPLNRRGVGSQ